MKKLSELAGEQFFDAIYALTPLLSALEKIDFEGLPDKTNQSGTPFLIGIVSRLFPVAISKENRRCVWEFLSILEEKSLDEIKDYPAPKIVFKLRKIFSDGELTNFLSYAEK